MRKIIVSEFITLDGVMEDPGGAEKSERGGWAFHLSNGTKTIIAMGSLRPFYE